MPMLTVRLSDEEMARLKEIAAPGSVAAQMRRWIRTPPGRRRRMVAEDVPTILDALATGASQTQLAKKYGVTHATIGNVARGWVPRPQSAIDDFYRRKEVQRVRGTPKIPRTPKPPAQRSAHDAVYDAVTSGRLTRLPCVMCGDVKSEAHHPRGYGDDHKLDVKWLCDKHHKAAHVVMRAVRAPEKAKDWGRIIAPAPNDECANCGHDKQSFHLGGKCEFPLGTRRCPCPAFVEDLGFG